MSTLTDVEAAAEALSVEDKRELILRLLSRLWAEGMGSLTLGELV